MGQPMHMMSPDHRVTHYRALAQEVQYLASEARFEEVRAEFLALAQSWLSTADTMERNLIEHHILPSPLASNWLKVA